MHVHANAESLSCVYRALRRTCQLGMGARVGRVVFVPEGLGGDGCGLLF